MSRLSGGSPSAPRWSASPSPRAPRFRRSELAAVGRRELLRWVNRTVGVEYVQVESCADGVALAQLVDAAYLDARVPLYRLDFATRHEHDRARNLEVVRATLDRLDLDVPPDVKEMSRGAYRACDEALRWLYLVVQRERPRSATRGYDGRARRLEALEKRRYLRARRRKARAGARRRAGTTGAAETLRTRRRRRRRRRRRTPTATRLSRSFARACRWTTAWRTATGSDGGRGLEMSVDSLDCPGEEDDPFSRGGEKRNLATRKENSARALSPSERKTQSDDWRGRGRGRGRGPRRVVRPATAPLARRRSTVSVVASARVDISPEPEPDPRRSPREEAEAEPSSGDETVRRARADPVRRALFALPATVVGASLHAAPVAGQVGGEGAPETRESRASVTARRRRSGVPRVARLRTSRARTKTRVRRRVVVVVFGRRRRARTRSARFRASQTGRRPPRGRRNARRGSGERRARRRWPERRATPRLGTV